MATDTINNDLYVNGNLSAKTFTPPASSITNTSVAGNAGIATTKLDHRFTQVYAQPGGSAGTTERKVVHVAQADGEVVAFAAGSRTANAGAATITADLLKNGSSVLSAVITLDDANAAYTPEAGTVSGTAYVAGDVFEVSVVATAGGGTLGDGVFAKAVFDEEAQ